MKKITTLVIALMMALYLLTFSGCASGGEVKVDLVQYGTQNIVGSATLNTTADGELIVQVNMDTESNLVGYDVVAIMVYSDPSEGLGPPDEVGYFADVLNTDTKGNGSATVKTNINAPQENNSIWVTVHVRAHELPSPPEGDIPPPPDDASASEPPADFVPPEYESIPAPVELPLNK
jgi:hypothetical protein